jgi:hypothetical protein
MTVKLKKKAKATSASEVVETPVVETPAVEPTAETPAGEPSAETPAEPVAEVAKSKAPAGRKWLVRADAEGLGRQWFLTAYDRLQPWRYFADQFETEADAKTAMGEIVPVKGMRLGVVPYDEGRYYTDNKIPHSERPQVKRVSAPAVAAAVAAEPIAAE